MAKALLFFLLVIPFLGTSQTAYSEIDIWATQTPNELTKDVGVLSDYLIQKCNTDTDKARSFFTWITEHIKYDKDNYGHRIDLEIKNILRNRKTLCQGYANLFKTLCDEASIPCIVVSGYARSPYNLPDTLIAENVFSEPGHAWNVVKLDSNFYLIDPTWGAGTTNRLGYYQKRRDEKYFLSPPDDLVKTHFPYNPTFQLLNNPWSFEAFCNQNSAVHSSVRLNYPDSINTILETKGIDFQLATQFDMSMRNPYQIEAIISNQFSWEVFKYFGANESKKAKARKKLLNLLTMANDFDPKLRTKLLKMAEDFTITDLN